jgi:membrane fusion protein (multidrug efflux system)
VTGSKRAKLVALCVALAVAAGGARLVAVNAARAGAAAAPAVDAPAAKDGGGAAATGAGEEKAATYPVVTVAPAPQVFRQKVHGYGLLQADVRSAHAVTMATVGVVRAVEVLPGQRVAKGQALFSVEPDPLALLAYRQAESAAGLARAEVARLAAQRSDHLATATQVETAEKALADAEAALEAARRQGAAAGTEVLRAPVDGIVAALGVGVGDRPAVGTALATVMPANGASATLGVEPAEARLVHSGDAVKVRIVQLGTRERTGRVTVVGAAIDKTSRLVTVSVALDDKAFGDAPAGSAVEAEIETRAVDAFSVPRTAIVQDENGPAVFEVADGKARRVPVVIEVDDGSRVGVSGALDKARAVVTTGAYELEDGVAVTERKP